MQKGHSAIINTVITGFVLTWPEAIGYGLKLLSVFGLAMAAELGRRLIMRVFGGK